MERQITNYELPDSYNENRIVLMVRDPYNLFVYWEISKLRRNLVCHHFNCIWEELSPILRLYDVTGIEFDGQNANCYFDIKINSMANNWYFHDISPYREYFADYGVVTCNGDYLTILRSKTVRTPGEREVGLTTFIRNTSNRDTAKKVSRFDNISSYNVYHDIY